MGKKESVFISIAVAFFPVGLLAYGSLDEFISSNGQTLRTSTVFSSDQIVSPRWADDSTIQLILCTAGSSYTAAPINFNTTLATELLADIDASAGEWNAVSAGPQFLIPAINSAGCGPALGAADSTSAPNGQNRISFTNTLPAGVIAYANVHYELADGVLEIVESDIEFNVNYNTMSAAEGYVLGSCFSCGGSCGASCTTYASPMSFRGILTHEMGHLLGLSHSMAADELDSDPIVGASMFPAIGSLVESRAIESLETDDEVSKISLYDPDYFPNGSAGVVSGNIRFADGRSGFRAAHVYAYDIVGDRTIVGTFSGMSGTLAETDGEFTLRGIPFNTPFIIVVEPIHRPDVHQNLTYTAFNAPVSVALLSQTTGLRDFAVEAYPDALIVDIRAESSSTSGVGISSADSLQLTSAAPSISGIEIYVSDDYSAPNDLQALEVTFAGVSTAISNTNPFLIEIDSVMDLATLVSPSLQLTASLGAVTSTWTGGIPGNLIWSGTGLSFCLDASSILPASGTYTVSLTLEDDYYGFSQTESAAVTLGTWTLSSCDLLDGDEDEEPDPDTGGGGGGRSLQAEVGPESASMVFIIFTFAISLMMFVRKSYFL